MILALAPIVFLFTYVYLKDEYEREPLRYLIISFILGVSTAFPVIIIGEFLGEYTGTSAASPPLQLFTYAMLVVATTEEGMKFLVLRLYNYNHKEFDEPYDGIMYAVAISLGFAAIENVLYVFNYGFETGVLRMFTAVPGHAMFGVLMGYFAGRAKFMESRSEATLELAKGLIIAILFHGLYDYFLFLGRWVNLTMLAFVVLILGIILARKAMTQHAAISPHNQGGNNDPEEHIS